MEENKDTLKQVSLPKDEENVTSETVISESPEKEENLLESKKTPSKVKKHHLVKTLVSQAKEMVEASEAQLQECKLLLESDLKEYNEAKATLRANALEQSQVLLEELGYDPLEDEEEDEIIFEAKEDLPPMQLKDINSGKFTGFIFSVLAGIGTFIALVYLATEKLHMTLDISKVPERNNLEKIFSWFSHIVGYTGNASFYVGLTVVILITLLVMWIVYLVRVTLKTNKNLHFAQNQLESAKEYVAHKGNCKEEMDKVDAHIKDAISTLKDYEILLAEQNGKLRRILHFEGFKDDQSEYAERSRHTMHLTQSLLESIKRFMATPMSEEGKLSGKSTLFLHSAKEKIQKVLQSLE